MKDGFSLVPMQGVLVQKIVNKFGRQPGARAYCGAAALSNDHIVLFGGKSTELLNDVRILKANSMEWKLIKEQEEKTELYSRFAHCVGTFGNYLVVFGG